MNASSNNQRASPSTRRPLFIQMSGPPGSGKTTTANLLAQKINAYAIPHDTIKSTLLEQGVPFDQSSKVAYAMDWALADEAMKLRRNVILDSTCNYTETLNQGQKLAQKHGYSYWYIEIRTDMHHLGLLDERLKRRAPLRAQRTAVDALPSDAIQCGHITDDPKARFMNWMLNPCRPDENLIVVGVEDSVEERIANILGQLSG